MSNLWTLSSQTEDDDSPPTPSSPHQVSSPPFAATHNISRPQGCVEVIFNTSGTTDGAEMEAMSRHVKDFLLAFLYLIGGPANVINMAVFFKQSLKDRVNLCLFSLALADELYLTMAMFLHGEQLHLQFSTGERYGPLATFMINNHLTVLGGFCYVSPVLSAVIATERCLCIFNPLKFQRLFRTRTMGILIVVVMVLMLTVQTIVAFRYHIGCVYDPVSGAVMQTFVDGQFYKAHRELVNKLDAFVFGSGLPITVMMMVTVMTVITAWKLHQIVSWREGTSSSMVSAREVALTKMLVGNSILFIACIFPTAGIRFVWLFLSATTSGQQNQNLFLTSLWIAELFTFVNASLNIFVYYSMGSRYRQTFWSLFAACRLQRSQEKKENSSTIIQAVQ